MQHGTLVEPATLVPISLVFIQMLRENHYIPCKCYLWRLHQPYHIFGREATTASIVIVLRTSLQGRLLIDKTHPFEVSFIKSLH